MVETIFKNLNALDGFFWGYIAFVLILILGIYLTLKNRFFQIRQLPSTAKLFFGYLVKPEEKSIRGVHPLKAFFASVGGMIGIGNIVGIVTAIQIGGPGALFWVWVAGVIGAVIKYSEIYLGIKYRVENKRGSYDGGPMYFLRAAFNNGFLPTLIAVLLCVYGVEIYQFTVITESVTSNWQCNRYIVILFLLGAIFYSSLGGVKRIGKICSLIMPFFMITYLFMALWIILKEIHMIPGVLSTVLLSAFKGHAAIGGFAGSSIILAIQQGIARAAYSADIGIGYDSIIQSESSTVFPEKQARLSILGVFIDNLVCTLSILLVLISGVWKSNIAIAGSHLVQEALSLYFPYMHVFIPIFLIVCGFTTVIAYFCVGLKCARFLVPRYGLIAYAFYAACAFIFFTFFDQSKALIVMSIAGSLLLIINLLGIFRLRKQIYFPLEPKIFKKAEISQ